ncbi:plastid movement impaired 1-related 1-like protein [Tanacetum coccineum]
MTRHSLNLVCKASYVENRGNENEEELNYARFLHATIHSERDSHVHQALEMIRANINSNEGNKGELYYQLGIGLYRIGDGEGAKKALEECLKIDGTLWEARNLLENVELILRADEPKNTISKSTLLKHVAVAGGLALGVTCGCLSKSKLLKHVAVAVELRTVFCWGLKKACRTDEKVLRRIRGHKLVELKVKHARLSVDSLNTVLMLTSLTLESLHLYDENITKLNMCVPNLQVLNLVSVNGLIDPKIHLLNLKSRTTNDVGRVCMLQAYSFLGNIKVLPCHKSMTMTPRDERVLERQRGRREVSVEESVLVPQFKMTEVHVAGVKTEPASCKKPLWGSNTKQQHAGCRWLVANGMGKTNAKHSLMKSKADTSDKSPGSLWSISSKGKMIS